MVSGIHEIDSELQGEKEKQGTNLGDHICFLLW